MRVAIETSSLFPLFVFTPYTYALYDTLGEIFDNGGEIVVHSDSIEEAKQISIIPKTKEILEFMQGFHSNNKLSFIRSILEYFPGNMYGNNSARAVALFVLDVLDSIPEGLPYNEFEKILKLNLLSKIKSIEDVLEPKNNKIVANPNLIQSYWYPRIDASDLIPIAIIIRKNQMQPTSTKNIDRDVFHFELALNDGDIDEMIVCDQGFLKQIPENLLNRLPVRTLKPRKLPRIDSLQKPLN